MKKWATKWLIRVLIILIAVFVISMAIIIFSNRNKQGKSLFASLIMARLADGVLDDQKDDSTETETLENSEKFLQYKSYDYHLKCLEVDENESPYHTASFDLGDGNVTTKSVKYRKIIGADESQFVFAHPASSTLTNTGVDGVVMQNPENYVDVFNDWTIDRIELFYDKNASENNVANTCVVPTEVMRYTRNEKVIQEFKNFILSEKTSEELQNPYAYEGGPPLEDICADFYIRVYFKESESIVWETRIDHYYMDEQYDVKYDDLYLIDCERKPLPSALQNQVKAGIFNYRELFEWIDAGFKYLHSN